jgi:predicted double-glycine peptidase
MNFVHFVVIEGFDDGAVYVNDPSCGPLEIPRHRFDLAFTGTAARR